MALSSKYTKGIEIEIGGNTTKLKTALDSANSAIKTTKSELDTLQNSLKLDWDANNFKRSQELAQRAVQQTQEKAEMLKKALAELDKQGDGKNTEQYEAIRRELSYVQVEAQKAQERLSEINNLSLERVKKELDEIASSLNNAGNKLTAGVTAPLVAAGTAAVTYASNTQEAVNKVEVAFDSAADKVKSWAQTTLTSIGLAEGTALDMAALYGDMATSMKFADDQAAQMSMTLVNLAGDLASFKNISVDSANTALKGIFTGETEALKNLGVVMTEANLKAYALAEGYSVTYEQMTQLEKVQLRYQYVLDQTQNAQGDFARTSDNTANQLRVCQESLKELAATAGEDLLPIVTPLIENVNGLLQSFGELDEATRGNITRALLFAASLGPMLKLTGTLTSSVSALITAYSGLTTWLGAKQAADVAATATQTGLNAAMNANPVTALITAIGALVSIVGAYAISAKLAGDEVEVLTDKVKASREAFAEQQAELDRESGAMLSALESVAALSAQESRSAEEKSRLIALVAQLNDSVPDLSLAYNEQTDTLSMTTEQVREYIDALMEQERAASVIERLKTLRQEQVDLEAALADAEAEVAATMAALEQAAKNNSTSIAAAGAAATKAMDNYSALVAAIEANTSETHALENEYGNLLTSSDAAAGGISGLGDSADATAASLQKLRSIVSEVKDTYELLADAQAETADTGYLTLDSIEKLMDSGLEKYLVEVEGGYKLAEGALEDYMSAQRAEYTVAFDTARAAAIELVNQNVNETASINETTEALKRKLQALKAEALAKVNAVASQAPDRGSMYSQAAWVQQQKEYQEASAQLQAYTQALKDLDAAESDLKSFDRASSTLYRDYVSPDGSGSSGGSSASGAKEQTQAEKDLAAYKSAVAELDHLKAMDLIAEEEYYARKGELAAAYLTENEDELKAWREELYSYQKGAYDRDLAALTASLENGRITQEQYFDSLAGLRDKYFEENTDGWLAAEREFQAKIAQANNEAYEAQRADLDYFHRIGLYSDEEYYAELAKLRNEYLAENSSTWRSVTLEIYEWTKEQRAAELEALEADLEAQLKALEEACDERLDALQDSLDTELDALDSALDDQLASAKASYSAQKTAAKDAYDANKDAAKDAYETQKDAAKAAYTAQKDAAKEAYTAQKKAAKEAYTAQKEAAQEAYEARKQQIQDELSAEKERLNTIIANIDKEIQARKELREDEDQDEAIAKAQKRLEAARAQLAFARTDEDKAEREKEVIRLQEALEAAIQDKEDTAFYRAKELEKEAVEAQIDAAQEAASEALAAAEVDYKSKLAELEVAYDGAVADIEASYALKTAEIQADYDSRMTTLETEYESLVAKLEADYKSQLAAMEAAYENQVAELEAEYARQAAEAQAAYDRQVASIKAEYASQISEAQSEHQAAVSGTPISHGNIASGETAAATLAKATAALAGSMASASGAVSPPPVIKNANAQVTINQASSLTSGQISAALEKALAKLSR